jgi:transcriptional regulator with XRE-family HTH domain
MNTIKLPETDGDNTKVRKEFTQRLAGNIRDARKSEGISQEELGGRAKLHSAYVAHLEAGKYHPTVYVLWKIAKALGKTLNDLVNF